MLRRRCCFISEDSLPHPPPRSFPISLAGYPPSLEERALPVSDLAPSYLSFLPSVPVLVVSPGPTFIARCGICDSSGTDCSSDVFVPDPTFVLPSALPFHSFSLIRPSLTLSSLSLSPFIFSAALPSPRVLQPCNGARQFFFFAPTPIDFRIIDFLHRLHRG